MAVGHDHAQWGADPSGVSLVSITASPGTDGVVVSHNAGVGDRRGCRLARCPPAGDGRRQPRCLGGPRMTLLQLSVLHRISALAPVTAQPTAQPTAHRPSSVLPQHSTETHSGDN